MKRLIALSGAVVTGLLLSVSLSAADYHYDPAAMFYMETPLTSSPNEVTTFGLQLHTNPSIAFNRSGRGLQPILDFEFTTNGFSDLRSQGFSVLKRDYSLGAEGGIVGIDWAVIVAGVVAAGVIIETVSDDDEEQDNQTPTTTDPGDPGGPPIAVCIPPQVINPADPTTCMDLPIPVPAVCIPPQVINPADPTMCMDLPIPVPAVCTPPQVINPADPTMCMDLPI